VTARGTGDLVELVLGDSRTQRRDFCDLMSLRGGVLAEKRCLTVGAGGREKRNDLIHLFGGEKDAVVSLVSGLSSPLFLLFVFFGGVRLLFDARRIGGGRFGRVGGVESQALFQVGDALLLLLYELQQLQNQRLRFFGGLLPDFCR